MLVKTGLSQDKRKKEIVRLILRVGLVLLILISASITFWRWTAMDPLSAPPESSFAEEAGIEVGARNLKASWGSQRLEEYRGINRVVLVGDAAMRGRAEGVLLGPELAEIERQLGDWWDHHISSLRGQLAVRARLRWHFHDVLDFVSPDVRAELSALGRALPTTDAPPEPSFQRLVYYQAADEVAGILRGRTEADSVTLAALEQASSNSPRILVGRSFVFSAGEIVAPHTTVFFVKPTGQLAFASVAWPGMVGVVTGVNSEKVFVAWNPATTDDEPAPGIPLSLLARRILEQAKTLDEAVNLLKRAKPMASAVWTLADGKSGQAVVVERSPSRVAVRKPEDNVLIATSHFVHKVHKSDASNDRTRRYTPSGFHFDRMQELARKMVTPSASKMVQLLRDKKRVGGVLAPLGDQAVLDGLDAAYGVVFDLERLVMWVCHGPGLSGRFVATDLKPFLGLSGEANESVQDIESDSLESSAAFEQYRFMRREVEYADHLRVTGQIRAAITHARFAVLAAPALPETVLLLADLLWQAGERDEARKYYQQIAGLSPAFKQDEEHAAHRLLN